MPAREYDVTIERKVRNTFRVTATSRTEAAAKVGAQLLGEQPFDGTVQVEIHRSFSTPVVVDEGDVAGESDEDTTTTT